MLDAFQLDDVTLVTFSAGSGEAVRYLTRHGTGHVARLAMIAPTTPLLIRQDGNPDGVDPALFEHFIETGLRPDWLGWLDRNARPFGGPGATSSELEEVVALARQASPHALEASYRALTTTDFRGELRALRLPVLVVQGEQDVSSPPHLTGHPTAALMVPQVLATLHVLFPGEGRTRAFGIALGTGGAVGFLLGGWLVTPDPVGLAWRSVFLVSLPIGGAVALAAVRMVPVLPGGFTTTGTAEEVAGRT